MSCTIFNLTNQEAVATQLFYSEADRLLITIVIPIITTLGVTSNVVFVLTIFHLRGMHNSLNTYLGHLAISDILFLTIACCFYLLIYNSSPILYNMPVSSSLGCVVFNVPFYFGHLASMGFITLISIERFYAICHPIRHRVIKTNKRTILLVTITWLSTIGVALLLVPGYSKFSKMCVEWPKKPMFQDFPATYTNCIPIITSFQCSPEFLLSFTFMAALIINMVLHIQIIFTISRRSASFEMGSEQARNNRNATRKVTLTLAVNTLIYFLCQTPYRLHTIDTIFNSVFDRQLLGFDTDTGSTLWIISEVCLFVNSAINPFVFAVGSPIYRQGLRDVLMIIICRRPKLKQKHGTTNWINQTSLDRRRTKSDPTSVDL